MKTVIVTGSSAGIGLAIGQRFKEGGWRVLGIDKTPPEADCGIELYLGDVSDPAFWNDDVKSHVERSSPIDAVINNAAVLIRRPLLNTTLDDWEQTIDVNLRSAFLSASSLAAHIAPGGSIVNVSSVHAVCTSPGLAAYAASKGGLVALTRSMALELAPRKVRVNAVLPGAIDTGMLRDGMRLRDGAGTVEDRIAFLVEKTPLRRIGNPGDIAEAVYFLCDSDRAGFITGQSLIVDGGATAQLATE